jgi:hypothetical protein
MRGGGASSSGCTTVEGRFDNQPDRSFGDEKVDRELEGKWTGETGFDFEPQAVERTSESKPTPILEQLIGLLIDPEDQDELESLVGIVGR